MVFRALEISRNTTKPSVRVAGVPVDVGSSHVPNTLVKDGRYIKQPESGRCRKQGFQKHEAALPTTTSPILVKT